MNKNDYTQVLAELLNRAQAGKHTKFEYICTLREYKFRKIERRTIKFVIKNLNSNAKSLFKSHCKDIKQGTSDVTKLLLRNAILSAIEFYREEFLIFDDMIREYEAYLACDHFISSFVGEIRPISEKHDHRRLK